MAHLLLLHALLAKQARPVKATDGVLIRFIQGAITGRLVICNRATPASSPEWLRIFDTSLARA
jgi:hypothetical protein